MQEKIKLSGEWSYRADKGRVGGENRFFDPSFDSSSWKTMNIPSNWEAAGLRDHSGVVWFIRKFEIENSKLKIKEYFIRFGGVDYFADVWLNGKKLGFHEGYFQPFEFDVTRIIKEGDNVLVAKVDSPKEGDSWPPRKRLIKGVFGHHDIRPGAWSKELGQSHGTGGIWNDVEIIATDKIRVKGVKVVGKLSGLVKGVIELESCFSNTVVGSVVVRVKEVQSTNCKVQKKYKVKIKPGSKNLKFELKIKNPKLWWCWDHGEPNLYEAEVEIQVKGIKAVKDVKAVRFGIKEIKKSKDGAWGLNGRKIFIRGSNIIPEEYLSTYTKERIAQDIKLIKGANVNAVRIHAHVNRKEFYDACDEAGILIWQDFALQWEYEQSKGFFDNARRQIRDMVDLLFNHPSIVAWCCHNEPTKSKDTLDPLLAREVSKIDESRIIFTSSNFAEHPYPGWFSGKMEYFSALPGKPFVTEFGAQALPSIDTLKKMFKPDELWPPKWEAWAYRDFTYEQYFNIAGLKTGGSLEEFVEISQDYQARLLKFAVETYRRHKFSEVFGVLHFMLLEPWPCISYSVLEYSRAPKKGYHALKRAFQPVLLIYVPERETLTIGDKIRGTFFLVNDLERGFSNASVEIGLEGGGGEVKFPPIFLDIESNSCGEITNNVYSQGASLRIPQGIGEGDYKLTLEIFDGNKTMISQNDYDVKLKRTPDGLLGFGAVFE